MASIYISLGSNIDPAFYLQQALQELRQLLGDIRCSSVYESEAVGFCGDNFLNMVVQGHTHLGIAELVHQFKAIELRHGRRPNARKFSSRTLDLDLLLYDSEVCHSPVSLPRAEILTNAFVLWPLAELAPQMIHPITAKSCFQLWDEYDKTRQKLWPVTVDIGQQA